MIVAAAEFAGIGYTKLQILLSILNMKIPQKKHHSMNIANSFVFPEFDAAWRKNLQEQIEVIKSSCRMLELPLNG